jgi:hypothetical protein
MHKNNDILVFQRGIVSADHSLTSSKRMSLKRKRVQTTPTEPSSTLCHRCRSMTATIKGIQALTSSHGFEHYDKTALHESAESGCSMCTFLLSFRTKAGSTESLRITLKAGAETKQFGSSNSQEDHPSSKTRFQMIRVYCPNNIFRHNSMDHADVDVFTTAGKTSAEKH